MTSTAWKKSSACIRKINPLKDAFFRGELFIAHADMLKARGPGDAPSRALPMDRLEWLDLDGRKSWAYEKWRTQ